MPHRTTLAELARIAERRFVPPKTREKALCELSRIFIAEGPDAASVYLSLVLPTLGLPAGERVRGSDG